MQSWQERLQGCFGSVDKKFGRHPADEKQAKELKKELDREGISWAVVEGEIRKFLHDCRPEHIEEELREAKRLLCFGEERK